jgi:type IV secretion system protein VirB1
MLDCPDLAVPPEVMQHVVNVESARNPFAIGVVGGYLAKQPASLDGALAAVRQLKEEGYNFSVGIAQVNRYNLAKYGLPDYASAFQACPNLRAGSRILRECYDRAQDWGKAFSCYYSGNFVTGFDHGYVQKIFASIRKAQYAVQDAPKAVRIIPYSSRAQRKIARDDNVPLTGAGQAATPGVASAYPEPYAIRRYLPNTQQSVAAPALAHVPAASGGSPMSSAENRSAIPMPGPGAVMANGGYALASGLSGIPVQIVGVGGDPYKTAIINSAAQPVAAGGLPMPNPDVLLSIGDSKASRAGKTSPSLMDARKGGELLQIHEATAPATPQGLKTQAMVDNSPDLATPQSTDKSFVF